MHPTKKAKKAKPAVKREIEVAPLYFYLEEDRPLDQYSKDNCSTDPHDMLEGDEDHIRAVKFQYVGEVSIDRSITVTDA